MDEVLDALKFAFTNKEKTDNIPDALSRIGIDVIDFCTLGHSIDLEVDGVEVTLQIEIRE